MLTPETTAKMAAQGADVSRSLKEALLESLTAILSPQHEVRIAGEEQIKVLEVTEEFGVHLAEFTVDPQGALAIRQLASVVLKQYVETHWSAQSEKFRPPETTEQAKHHIRQLLPIGLKESISKVRSSVAYAISAIAHWDWPEAWPDLFLQLMQALTSGDFNAVHGAMRVLTEFTREVTDAQMPQVAPVILPEMYKIFTQAEVYSIRTRGRAVEIFTTCANLIYTINEINKGAAKTLLFPVLNQFVEALGQALSVPDGPTSDSGLRMEVLKALTALVKNFPKQMLGWMAQILPAVPTYVSTEVNNAEDADDPVDSDGEVLGFENLIFSIFDFIHGLIETPKFRSTVKKSMRELIYYIIPYMQITEEQIKVWTENPDQFVEDEDDDTFSYSVRISAQDLLLAVSSEFQTESAAGITAAVTQHLQEAEQAKNAGSPHWWKLHESCMLALGSIKSLIIDMCNSGKIQFDLNGFLTSVVLADLNMPVSPFLLGRALWAASRFTLAMSPELVQRFLEATVNGLQPNQSPSVRISAVRAIFGYCDHLKQSGNTQLLVPYLPHVTEGLISIATQYASEVLALVLETLRIVLTIDHSFTASYESKIIPLSIAVFLKYNHDPLIASLTEDIFKELASIPTCQQPLQQRLLPTLISIMQAPADKVPHGLCSISMDILCGVVRSSATPLSDVLISQAFPACAQATLRTDDNSALQFFPSRHGFFRRVSTRRPACSAGLQCGSSHTRDVFVSAGGREKMAPGPKTLAIPLRIARGAAARTCSPCSQCAAILLSSGEAAQEKKSLADFSVPVALERLVRGDFSGEWGRAAFVTSPHCRRRLLASRRSPTPASFELRRQLLHEVRGTQRFALRPWETSVLRDFGSWRRRCVAVLIEQPRLQQFFGVFDIRAPPHRLQQAELSRSFAIRPSRWQAVQGWCWFQLRASPAIQITICTDFPFSGFSQRVKPATTSTCRDLQQLLPGGADYFSRRPTTGGTVCFTCISRCSTSGAASISMWPAAVVAVIFGRCRALSDAVFSSRYSAAGGAAYISMRCGPATRWAVFSSRYSTAGGAPYVSMRCGPATRWAVFSSRYPAAGGAPYVSMRCDLAARWAVVSSRCPATTGADYVSRCPTAGGAVDYVSRCRATGDFISHCLTARRADNGSRYAAIGGADSATALQQSGGECIRAYVSVACEQIIAWHDDAGNNGIYYVIQVALHLLDPRTSEFCASFVGKLLTALFKKAGERLGDSLDMLLRAVLSKLQQAETLSVIQSLVMVFAHLMHTRLEDLLEFLCSVPGPTGNTALEFVLSEWCEKQHLFYGAYEGKVSSVALSKLLSHGISKNNDVTKKLQEVTVKGDQIFNHEGIRTRSKAASQPEQWTMVPVLVKLYKLLINELSSQIENNMSRQASAGGEDLDDEEGWDDDDDDDAGDEEAMGQTLSQLLDVGGAGIYGYDDFDDEEEDDPDAAKDELNQVDLQAYLTDYLQQLAQQPCHSAFLQHLTDSEKRVLASIGIPV
ncbi:IPO9 [Branchiostoma lanceolatum]|uniref:IPO9 protein n=1 Tax=Branchiostoma lanceolatum TaxID=7740 RepID=A0A8K0ESY0_BRALA|nr:IPO9 [Branchiostoma lanceolatum]